MMQMESPPSDNLYFADLPAGFDEAACQSIFGAYGQIVQSKILPTAAPGGKVSALLRFGSLDEAKWIVENLNGNIPQGLTEPIIARFAAAKPGVPGKGSGIKGAGMPPAMAMRATPYGAAAFPGMPGMFNGAAMPGMMGGKGAGKISIKVLYQGLLAAQALPGAAMVDQETNTLYVAGLPIDTTDLDLFRIFSPFGAIAPRGVRAMMFPEGTCKGFGFVNFLDPMAAEMAANTLNGTTLPDGTVLQVKPKSPNMKGVDMGMMAGMLPDGFA